MGPLSHLVSEALNSHLHSSVDQWDCHSDREISVALFLKGRFNVGNVWKSWLSSSGLCMLSSTWKAWGNIFPECFVTGTWEQSPLFIYPAWGLVSAPREWITETYSGFGAAIIYFGLMNSGAWAAWMERKQMQNPSKFMSLCTGGEPWGQPPERVRRQLGFRAKMRGCKGQVAAASLSLSEGWMLLKLLSLCRVRRAMSLCQRSGWEKSVKKEITSKKATKWVGSWPGSLRQMALLVATAATENPGDNRGSWQMFKDCYQLLSPNDISFSTKERKLCTATPLPSLHHFMVKMLFRHC